jgi:hypothetical protein
VKQWLLTLAVLLAAGSSSALAQARPAGPQATSKSLQDPVTAPPARTYEQAMTELLGVNEAERTTNADQNLCVLFVVDVSGSMNDLRGDGESRIVHVQRKLQDMIKSPLLSGERAYLGIMSVGASDPGYDYRKYVVPFTTRRDKSGIQDPIEGLSRLVPQADRGSSLRLAHYRGLQAIQAFTARSPSTQWRKFLILLSDCYLDGPRPVGGPDFQVFDRFQQPRSTEYQDWLRYATQSGISTLVVEPYNPDWRTGPAISNKKNVFPDDLAAVTPHIRASDMPGALQAVVEGICVKGPESSASTITGPDASVLAGVSQDQALSGAHVHAAVEAKNAPSAALDQESGLNGRFFLVLTWPPGDMSGERRVTLSAEAGGYRGAGAQTITVRPGDRAVYVVSLAPNTDWRIPLVAGFLGLLLVWLAWPWELRVNAQARPSILHLFQPVRLFDRDTNRAVATVFHFGINWLSVKGRATVRVNGNKGPAFGPIPGRCTVEISTGNKIATFLLESGFMKPGGKSNRPAGAAPPRTPAQPRR